MDSGHLEHLYYGRRIRFRDTGAQILWKKKEAVQKKRTDLIDLYTSDDIDRDEFTALRAKYDAEIDSLKSMAESMEKQQVVIAKQKERTEDIKNAVDKLMEGIEYEDELYTQLLDKMVINDREDIDIYLKNGAIRLQAA